MAIKLNGETYYRTAEACQLAGISRNTFFRWLREGLFTDVGTRDRRGWRLFTEDEIVRLKAEANRVSKTTQLRTTPGSTGAVASVGVRNEKR